MSPAPPRPPADDDPNAEKLKPEKEQIEKVKADKEHPEKLKPEKEHKLEFKEIEKVKSDKEHPEKIKADKEGEKLKFEKEHKLEAKEIEKVKSDKEHPEKIKADKEGEKLKFEKEHKAEAKIEVREKQFPDKLDKEVAEGTVPGGEVVNPALGLDPSTLLAHADSLEHTGRQLRHFIERSLRPDLSTGALNNEEDLREEEDG
jgi:hypothetical protein